MRIGDRELACGAPPYVIAELGVNHDGSVERALELVEAARQAGADAVKLQWFEADRLLSRAARLARYQQNSGAGDPHELLRGLELHAADFDRIIDRGHRLGLHAIVTVFSVELVEAGAQRPWDALKSASPDIVNRPLLDAMMATGKPLLVSCGAATLEEIRTTIEWLGDHPHLLMQCVSAYPTPDDHAGLGGLRAMRSVSENALGYSDHTAAVDAGALAVAAGACVLEKHLTHDRSARGPDHAASLDPPAFAEYVRLAHRAWRMLGRSDKRVLDIEEDVRSASRQSIVSARALGANHVITRDDLTIKRPGCGIAPARLDDILGRRLAQTIEADVPLREEDLS